MCDWVFVFDFVTIIHWITDGLLLQYLDEVSCVTCSLYGHINNIHS